MKGPHEDLETYLEAVNQLKSIVRFFSSNKNLKSSIGVITQATTLLQKASLMLEEEFWALLSAYRFDFYVFAIQHLLFSSNSAMVVLPYLISYNDELVFVCMYVFQ